MSDFDYQTTIKRLESEIERLRYMNQVKLEVIHSLQTEISKLKAGHDDPEWFGKVRWCEEDLVGALKDKEYPVTENNVKKLYDQCSSHWFIDYMVEAGWDYIYSCIDCDNTLDKYEE